MKLEGKRYIKYRFDIVDGNFGEKRSIFDLQGSTFIYIIDYIHEVPFI